MVSKNKTDPVHSHHTALFVYLHSLVIDPLLLLLLRVVPLSLRRSLPPSVKANHAQTQQASVKHRLTGESPYIVNLTSSDHIQLHNYLIG